MAAGKTRDARLRGGVKPRSPTSFVMFRHLEMAVRDWLKDLHPGWTSADIGDLPTLPPVLYLCPSRIPRRFPSTEAA